MRIKKLLVLSALSLTVIGSSVLTSSQEVEARKLSKYEKKIYNNAFTLKNTDASVNSLIKKFKSGKAFNIKFKSRKTAKKVFDKVRVKTGTNLEYLDILNGEYHDTFNVEWELWEEYWRGGYIKKHHIIYVDKKLCKGLKKAIAKSEKEIADNKAFTQNTLIPAVYDKYWELLEQGKSVKPMYWGDNGYDNLDISKYQAICRSIHSGTKPEFDELSEVSRVYILTYTIERHNDAIENVGVPNSWDVNSTNTKRLNAYLDSVCNNKPLTLECQTTYAYSALLVKQLGFNTDHKFTEIDGYHAWGTLTCKDYNGNNRLMECNRSGFYIAGDEDNWCITAEGESTHAMTDMFAYLNSELEYLGY